MADFQIWPLRTGTIMVDKGEYVTRGIGRGVQVGLPATAWYLTDGSHRILVDTGMCHTTLAHWHHPGSSQLEGESIQDQLESIGVNANDIETIILTHLHWDHCHNLSYFPDARVVVNDTELRFALDPVPLYDKSYEHARLGLTAPFVGRRLDTVAGDATIIPGIDVFPTPGHSPGHQSVAVSTQLGTYVIAGDAVFSYENLRPAGPNLRFTLMGRVMDVVAAWRSMERIVERADLVLPGHDSTVLEAEVYPRTGDRKIASAGKPTPS
jgi:N-acyl homoserine lactone hydrolase